MPPTQLSKSISNIWAQVHSPVGLPFPHTVAALLTEGVTRYHVDYVAATNTAYAENGIVDVAPMPSHLENITISSWSADGIRAAIRKVQKAELTHAEFSKECLEAGVTNYFAYPEGKRVIYMGAKGDMHIEWFPGAKPEDK